MSFSFHVEGKLSIRKSCFMLLLSWGLMSNAGSVLRPSKGTTWRQIKVICAREFVDESEDSVGFLADRQVLLDWVVVKEFNFSYYIGDTLLLTIYIYTHSIW